LPSGHGSVYTLMYKQGDKVQPTYRLHVSGWKDNQFALFSGVYKYDRVVKTNINKEIDT